MAHTLQQYRRALAREVGQFSVQQVGSLAPDAGQVVLSALATPLGGAPASRYDLCWVYGVAGSAIGLSRRVKAGGYVAATGALLLEFGFTAIPDVGSLFEILPTFPAYNQTGAETSYQEIISLALRHLLIPDQITVTTVAGANVYLLPVWLDRSERLVAVRDTSLGHAGDPQPTWRKWAWFGNAETPYLRFSAPYTTSGALVTLDVLRPADTWTNTTGIWADAVGGTGLTADSFQAQPDLNSVTAVGKMFAYLALHQQYGTTTAWDRFEEQEKRVMKLLRFDRSEYEPRSDAAQKVAAAPPDAADAAA